MLYIAAGLGALLAHYPMERIGRRGTLLACDVLYVTGGLLCSIVPDYRLIVVGRTLTGVGIGAVLNGCDGVAGCGGDTEGGSAGKRFDCQRGHGAYCS